jgi:hypothetical protein
MILAGRFGCMAKWYRRNMKNGVVIASLGAWVGILLVARVLREEKSTLGEPNVESTARMHTILVLDASLTALRRHSGGAW